MAAWVSIAEAMNVILHDAHSAALRTVAEDAGQTGADRAGINGHGRWSCSLVVRLLRKRWSAERLPIGTAAAIAPAAPNP